MVFHMFAPGSERILAAVQQPRTQRMFVFVSRPAYQSANPKANYIQRALAEYDLRANLESQRFGILFNWVFLTFPSP